MTELVFISGDVRAYMEQNHLEFTDFEKAALIFHADLPVLKEQELLEKLADGTEDASLREQILDRLTVERQDMEAFRKNTSGYVYAVEVRDKKEHEPYICGYFATAELAYAHGMKQECGFTIQKYRIVGFNGVEAKKLKGYMNPYLMDAEDIEDCITECVCGGHSEAEAQYDRDGTLEHFWSSEVERSDKENIRRSYDHALFKNAFIRVPNPFERGDIVRFARDGKEHGIVATSQTEWKEFLERVESGKAQWADFYDASITVDFLQNDGHMMHSHINPVYLEKFEPQKEDADYDVLLSASSIQQGEGTLDFFLMYLNKYQERLKEKARQRS